MQANVENGRSRCWYEIGSDDGNGRVILMVTIEGEGAGGSRRDSLEDAQMVMEAKTACSERCAGVRLCVRECFSCGCGWEGESGGTLAADFVGVDAKSVCAFRRRLGTHVHQRASCRSCRLKRNL